MGAPTWREYPHETALRLKREAAEALYDALGALAQAASGYPMSGVEFEERRIAAFDALAQARGEVSVHTLEGGL